MTVDQFAENDGAQFEDERYGSVESASVAPNITYLNESGVADEELSNALSGRRWKGEIASVIEQWSQSLASAPDQVSLDVFNRHRWQHNRNHPYAVMSQCAWAVENDDILSTLADVTEGLMWQKCRFELFDADQQSVWNQWARDVNLDALLRRMGRELFKVSQFYVGMWWEKKVYSVTDNPIQETLAAFEAEKEQADYDRQVAARERFIAVNANQPNFVEPPPIPDPSLSSPGRGNRKRKKKFPLMMPTAVTIFDPTKIVPVGSLMFGRERFAYVATVGEHEAFSAAIRGEMVDPTVMQLVEGAYTPTGMDKQACAEIDVDPNRLWLLKENAVFRHTLTKSDYERFAPVRLKSILPILEMKQHLRASDRATLIGATNFIVVITKGSDRLPAKQAEINNLQEQARIIARMPLLVGDHRLDVKIVSPAIDHTLDVTRYEVLDSRLVFKALQSYAPVVGHSAPKSGISEMSRVISKGMESRRDMISRSLESKIFQKIIDENEGTGLDEVPSLEFTPKRISLDFSTDIVAGVLKLRDRGDISRETALEELDYDQDVEVLRRAREKARYDQVFDSATPFSSPLANPYSADSQQPPQLVGYPPPPAPQVAPQPATPGGNLGPKGQPRTEGGRPSGVLETEPRKK